MAKYFVSYAYFVPHGPQGFGNIEADRSFPIAGTADITELTEHITDALRRTMKQPKVSITILSWCEFEPDIERQQRSPSSTDNVIQLPPPR